MIFTLPIVGLIVAGLATVIALFLRTVVPPNDIHVVQRRKTTTSYGTQTDNGNVYYNWPSWIPFWGVETTILPVSNFELKLTNYEGYDLGRVPFVVDVTAFFRIEDTNKAAQRVENFSILKQQLEEIVRGAVRRILATNDIDEIMVERAQLGQAFTDQVAEQISEWGVVVVKDIEFMDIRDAEGEKVVFNIMEKKRSFIERQSREEVAENLKTAEMAEITARKEVDIRDQEALQAVGERTAQQRQAVGIADEVAMQEIKVQQAITKEKEMAVLQVEEVRNAEILREKEIVKADEDRQTITIRADGDLAAKEREADGIRAIGEANAFAEKEMQLAPVHAQIELAKEIGENQGYQSYLQTIEGIGAYKQVGVKQAEALQDSDMKIIVNAGDIASGVTNVGDLFGTKGGTHLAGMVEAMKQTDGGQALLGALGIGTEANDPVADTRLKRTGTEPDLSDVTLKTPTKGTLEDTIKNTKGKTQRVRSGTLEDTIKSSKGKNSKE